MYNWNLTSQEGKISDAMNMYMWLYLQKPTEEILKLAKFLEVDCSDELIEKIADKCGFDKLKNAHWTMKKTESKVEHYRKGMTPFNII